MLAELADPAASRLAATAGPYLQKRAGFIADEDLRERFLAMPINRALAALGCA